MKTLIKWLRQVIHQGATTIELRSSVPLQSSEVESDKEEEILSLYDNLMETAQEDANNSGKVGPNRYRLKAYFTEKRPILSPHFSLRSDNDDDEVYESDEKPTKDDLMAQLMRHNEALLRVNVMSTKNIIEQLSSQNTRLLNSFDHNLDKRVELVEQKEKLLSEENERTLALERAQRDDERKDKIMEKVIPLLPVVVNKFLNSRKLPEPVNPKVEVLKNIARKIPPHKIGEIQAVLGTEISLQLMELFSSLDLDDEDEEESKAQNG